MWGEGLAKKGAKTTQSTERNPEKDYSRETKKKKKGAGKKTKRVDHSYTQKKVLNKETSHPQELTGLGKKGRYLETITRGPFCPRPGRPCKRKQPNPPIRGKGPSTEYAKESTEQDSLCGKGQLKRGKEGIEETCKGGHSKKIAGGGKVSSS